MIANAAQKPAVFAIHDLRKEYRMGEVTVSALRTVTADVYEGEFLVILGPSGSGKSTLLNIIGGIDTPTGGEVRFRGALLNQYTEADLTAYRRRYIGFVFQFFNLMPSLTAEENVEMATEIAQDPLDPLEALRLVGLEERRRHFPSQLSGGEQQRVAIARAIAKRPSILLCDEPTGSLDRTTGKIVLQALRDVCRSLGTTVIVITHNSAIGAMASRVIHMADGQIRDTVVNAQPCAAETLEW